ncbi:8279_t:CDS:1 [Entrophospora sp. SA101]|nr:8279_t:CDS:1 [Entrophospora sp. SA101]CAJ0839799.1 1054_t:CDS:1 [Entrophospora sp. SA101]
MNSISSRRESLSINGKKVPACLHPISVLHRIEKKMKKKSSFTFFKDDKVNKWHSTLNFLDKEYTTKEASVIQFKAHQKVAKSALDVILTNFTEEQLAELAKPNEPLPPYIEQLLTKSRLWWHHEAMQEAKSYQSYLKRYCKFQDLGIPKISSLIDEGGMLVVIIGIKKRRFHHTSSTNLNREAAIEEAAKTALLTLYYEHDNSEMDEIKSRMMVCDN